jgi:hypothetical protein
MQKTRILIFLTTILVVGIAGTIALLYAKGYRLDSETGEFGPNGLLVANSEPTGAQIFVDGELKSATNATVPLPPGTYDVELKKEGFLSWKKRISIAKEEVTQVDVSLFNQAPSNLSAITFSGATNPSLSPDITKIAYGVPADPDNPEKEGLWVLDTGNLPLGFNRDPRRITDGDMSEATWEWSPDSRQLLVTTPTAIYLLSDSEFVPQSQRVNVASQKAKILAEWEIEKTQKLNAQLAKLPDEFQDIFKTKTKDVIFSPNENKILYTATGSANLPEDVVKQLPGSSTQKQTRDIKPGIKYIYDIKEDRNFEIGVDGRPVYWFPTSHHLVIPEESKISIVDYDGTNKQTVFGGVYEFPHAYATTSNGRLIILTNFGASETSNQNLYSLGIK